MKSTSLLGGKSHALRIAALLLICLFTALPAAWGQTLSVADFEKAADGEGVGLIPFPSLRKEATSVADEVNRRKEEVKSWGFPAWETKKNALLKKKAEKDRQIDAKEKEIASIKSKFKTADVSTEERELANYKKELVSLNDEIADLNEDLADGAEAWERMWNARGGLREKFDDAKEELAKAKSNPKSYIGSSASEADVSKVKTLVDKIKYAIESEERGHLAAENDAKNAERKFRDLILKTAY